MSDVENQEVESNPLAELIDAIADQNFNQAKTHMDDLLADKMGDALEQEKVRVADTIFNDFDEDEELENLDDEDLGDEEVEETEFEEMQDNVEDEEI